MTAYRNPLDARWPCRKATCRAARRNLAFGRKDRGNTKPSERKLIYAAAIAAAVKPRGVTNDQR